jgi:arginase
MRIGLLGVPSSIGSHHAGQERAPAAVRDAGLAELLRAAGHEVHDRGDLAARVHRAAPRVDGVRAAGAVLALLDEVADAVASVVADGEVPLVLGGDCTVTLGVLAGVAARAPRLVYVDGDADLSTPAAGTGVLDSMGVSHLLGRGHPGMNAFAARSGLAPSDLVLVGTHPGEVEDVDRHVLNAAGVTVLDSDVVQADPAAAARAVAEVVGADRPVVVHLDVDVLDSGSVPLANFPHFGGLDVGTWGDLLAGLAGLPLAAVVLTEVNPTYDPSGEALRAVVEALGRLFRR